MAAAALSKAARHGGDLRKAGFTPQELANLAWAYACADHVDGAFLQRVWSDIARVAVEGHLPVWKFVADPNSRRASRGSPTLS